MRTITHLAVNRFGEFIWIDVEADGFLYNMVRAIAGTLVQVGRGFWPESQIADDPEGRWTARLAGPTAPPEGLFLMRVTYDRDAASRALELSSRRSRKRRRSTHVRLTYPAELEISPSQAAVRRP